MKKITLLFLIGILNSCSNDVSENVNLDEVFQNKIIAMVDDKEITIDKQKLKNQWEKQVLEEDGLAVSFEKFEIIESETDSDDNKSFFLMAKSEDGTITTGAFLTPTANGLMMGGKKCTCTGCSQGCELRIVGSSCSCSACFPRGGKCEKKEEGTTDIM